MLKTGGVYIALSLGLPLEEHFRKKHLHFEIKSVQDIALNKKLGNNVSATERLITEEFHRYITL